MKRYIYAILSLGALFMVESTSAQMKNSYFMEGSYFRNDLNPALRPTRGYIALPGISGIGVGVSGNLFSIDNFVFERDGGLVTALHSSVSADEFLSRLPEVGFTSIREDVNILGVGFYAGRSFWNFGVGFHATEDLTMSKDVFRALKTLGNGTFDLGNMALDFNGYLDAYLGASFPIGKHVTFGAKVKFLVGAMNASATFDEMSLNVGEERVEGVMRGSWRGNSVAFDNTNYDGEGGFDTLYRLDPAFILHNIKSFGAAIDLGLEVSILNDHLKLSAAVTDLGFIKWAPDSQVGGEVEGGFYYNGVNFETGSLDAGYEIDLDKITHLERAEGYTSRLTANLNVGVEYNFLNNHFAVGLLSHTRFHNSTIVSELTASFNIRPTNWMTLTASHTFLNNNRPGIFGAAINIHPRVINIFVGMDYIDTNLVGTGNIDLLGGRELLVSRYAKSFNIYAGIGFNFARPKYLRQASGKERKNRE